MDLEGDKNKVVLGGGASPLIREVPFVTSQMADHQRSVKRGGSRRANELTVSSQDGDFWWILIDFVGK